MTIWDSLKSFFSGQAIKPIQFKESWTVYLRNNLPLYQKLTNQLRDSLHEKIAQFVSTKYFEGCSDLELTDEMILTVAGQACLLIIKHDGAPYPNLKTVLLYPTTFSSSVDEIDIHGVVTRRSIHRLGESWNNGTVILAWDSVLHGAKNIYDGHNVTFHEFVHQLDQENGRTDGIPAMENSQAYHTWAQVLDDGYERLLDKAERGKRTVIDKYGTTNVAEFFAVATEAFFEKPTQLKKKQPAIYRELKAYYAIDPASWFSQ